MSLLHRKALESKLKENKSYSLPASNNSVHTTNKEVISTKQFEDFSNSIQQSKFSEAIEKMSKMIKSLKRLHGLDPKIYSILKNVVEALKLPKEKACAKLNMLSISCEHGARPEEKAIAAFLKNFNSLYSGSTSITNDSIKNLQNSFVTMCSKVKTCCKSKSSKDLSIQM